MTIWNALPMLILFLFAELLTFLGIKKFILSKFYYCWRDVWLNFIIASVMLVASFIVVFYIIHTRPFGAPLIFTIPIYLFVVNVVIGLITMGVCTEND